MTDEMLPLFSSAPGTASNRWRPRPRPAAGLLLRHTDAEGTWVLLGLRAPELGGTWSNIGGSLDRGEDPLAGALREFTEELDLPVSRLAGATLATTIQSGDEWVPYTLFVLDVPVAFDDARLQWEHDDLAWFHADDVHTLDLHRGFARAWVTLTEGAPTA